LEWPIPKYNFEPKIPYLGLRPAVNGEWQGATETGGDFASCLGNFGLDVHVGCEEDPTSKSACTFVPYYDEERERQSQDPLLLSNGKQIPCVEKAIYLGHAISGTLSGLWSTCLLRCSYAWADVKRIVFESMM
jgi:hypothetical protein